MKLSICCITYNHSAFIAQTIEGFLQQQFEDQFEIIISDDASPDHTQDILKEYKEKYPDRIRLILHEQNVGMMKNFTETLKACKGQYIALCEGDDYWTDSKKLQKQVSFLEQNPDFSLCAHNVIYKVGNKKKRNFQWDAPKVSDLQYLLRRGNYLSTLSVVFCNKSGVVDFLEKFPTAPLGDFLLYVSAARFGKIKILDDVMGVYRVHPGGIWSHSGSEKNFERLLWVLSALFDVLDKEYQDDLKIQLLGIIESINGIQNNEKIIEHPALSALMNKMDIAPFLKAYIQFNKHEKSKVSYYSRYIPFSILYRAILEKLRNQLPRL